MKTLAGSLLTLILLTHPAQAEGSNPRRTFSLGLALGAPHLVTLEGMFHKVKNLGFGLGLGFFPINSIAQKNIKPSPIDIGTNFKLNPDVTYTLTVPSVMARWYPWEYGFYTQLQFSRMVLKGDIAADLVFNPTGNTLEDAITGSVSINQNIVSLFVGGDLHLFERIYLTGALGVGYLPKTEVDVTLSGAGASIIAFGVGQSAVDSAITDLEKEISDAVNEVTNQFRIAPLAYVGVGANF